MNKLRILICPLLFFIVTSCSPQPILQSSAEKTGQAESEEIDMITWIHVFQPDIRLDTGASIDNGIAYYGMFSYQEDRGIFVGVQSYDLHKEKILWTLDDIAYGKMLVGEKHLFILDFFTGLDKEITCLDIDDGKIIWTTPISLSPYSNAPEMAYGGNKVFIGTENMIYSFNAETGNLLWEFSLPKNWWVNSAWLPNNSDYAALTYDDEKLFVRTSRSFNNNIDGKIIALDAQNGDKFWEKGFTIPAPLAGPPNSVASTPAIYEDSLFFIDWGGYAYLLNKNSGNLNWKSKFAYPWAGPIIHDAQIYFFTWDTQELVRLDMAGNKIWTVSLKDYMRSPIKIYKDSIWVITGARDNNEGKLLRVSKETGNIISEITLPQRVECPSCVITMEIENEDLFIILREGIISVKLSH